MKRLLATLIATLIAVVGTSRLSPAQAQGGCDVPCGTFLRTWGCNGCADGEFHSPGGPTGVAVDGSGNIFVIDPGNNRIQKFDSTGTFLTKWGSPGSGNGQFDIPKGVAVDGSGNVFVTEQGNSRIQKFTSTGTFLTTWRSPCSGNGHVDI